MKAQELRIGNLVIEKGKIKPMYSISNHNAKDYSTIKPIELTEEWLLRFGFKAHTYEDEVFGYVLNDFGYINEYQFRIRNFIDFEGIIIPKAIKTVHQLQNLYFALTGEELTL